MGTKKYRQSKVGSTEKRAGKLPEDGMMFAVVREMSGGSRMIAMCEDELTRMIRIPGRLKRRMWCRRHDLILIKPWVVQAEIRADLVYRYLPAEKRWLYRRNMVPENLII
jgi:translation initiation factor 1A